MKNGFELITTPHSEGRIVQEIFETENDARTILLRSVLDTRDEQTRKALIALGWTPPPGKFDTNQKPL